MDLAQRTALLELLATVQEEAAAGPLTLQIGSKGEGDQDEGFILLICPSPALKEAILGQIRVNNIWTQDFVIQVQELKHAVLLT